MVARFAAARAADRLALEIRAAHAAAPTLAELVRRTGSAPGTVRAELEMLVAAGQVLRAGDGEAAVFLHAEVVAALEREVMTRLELPREEIRRKLPAALPARAFDVVVEGLSRRGALVADGDALRPATPARARPAPTPLEATLAEKFAGWALEPPRPRELAQAVGRPEAEVNAAVAALVASGDVTRVKPDLYVDSAVLARLEGRLRAYLEEHAEISPQAWKELTGVSRKFSIPLAEYFDARKVTLRVGDLRRLRQR
jgi:selenocysteine-specific elongation factor